RKLLRDRGHGRGGGAGAPRRAEVARDAAVVLPHLQLPGGRRRDLGQRSAPAPRAARRLHPPAHPLADHGQGTGMKTRLITGAAGNVGGHLRRELAGRYALRLSDVKPVNGLGDDEKFVQGDIARMKDALLVTKGVDAVVHLGGFSVEGPWETILEANIVGLY